MTGRTKSNKVVSHCTGKGRNSRKKITKLDSVAKEVRPLTANSILVKGVLENKSPTKREQEMSNAITLECHNEDLKVKYLIHRRKFLTVFLKRRSGSRKKKRAKLNANEMEILRATFREAREMYFRAWSQGRIAEFI